MTDGSELNQVLSGDGVGRVPSSFPGKPPRHNAARGPGSRTGARAAIDKPKLRKHSEEEKLAKIKVIEEQIAGGKSTLKDAVKRVGISDETYYKWKRARAAAANPASVSGFSDAFGDLLKLEEENQRLRHSLAEKLRHENAELRRKLGLSD